MHVHIYARVHKQRFFVKLKLIHQSGNVINLITKLRKTIVYNIHIPTYRHTYTHKITINNWCCVINKCINA